jgi:hypothetical protein
MMFSILAPSLFSRWTWPEISWAWIAIASLMFLILSIGGLALVSAMVIRLPADYFSDQPQRGYWIDRHPALRWGGLIAKNLLGIALIGIGIVLSLPGVPGPGLLTILLGVMLTDFPGKRRLECWLIRRPAILSAVNGLRERYNKPPFVVD